MENKEMEDIKIEKEKMEKIIKEVEREFPNDIALQEVHIARRVLAEKAKKKGMSLWEYINWRYHKLEVHKNAGEKNDKMNNE